MLGSVANRAKAITGEGHQGSMAIVVWFKRDLRIYDHPALVAGVEDAVLRGEPLLPLYIVEPCYWDLPDVSGRHWATIAEGLEELRADLGRLGAPLVVRVGEAVDVLDDLASEVGVSSLWSHEEVGNLWTFARDRRVAAWAARHNVRWTELPQSPVVRRMREGMDWEAHRRAFLNAPSLRPPAAVPGVAGLSLGAIPTQAQLGLDDPCPGRQPGGRRAGISCLMSFLMERGERYRATISSPLESERTGGRISPHLAYGTLSAREVHRGIKGRLAQNPGEQWERSISGFAQRVAGRDYFMQQFESNCWIEARSIHPEMEGLRPPASAATLAAWENGETGFPFVDACMRHLRANGWINFRMRAMLVSFAAYQLWIDGREVGPVLARLFTDYEPGIHWPMIQMQSGTNPFSVPRIYNPIKQGLDQDKQGVFVRRWCPELAGVPLPFLQDPWSWEGAAALEGRYPRPIVDLADATRRARDAVFAFHSRGEKTGPGKGEEKSKGAGEGGRKGAGEDGREGKGKRSASGNRRPRGRGLPFEASDHAGAHRDKPAASSEGQLSLPL